MISVLLPTKDRLSSLKQTLPHYLAQPLVGEVIVVNDGSTDGTAQYLAGVAAADSKLKVIHHAPNQGIPISKNAALAAAEHDLVFFAEDDLELTPNFFETLVDHRRALGVEVIGGRNVFVDAGESVEAAAARMDTASAPYVDRRRVMVNTGIALSSDSYEMLLPNPVLMSREVARLVGFDPRYKVNAWREESDFQLSLQERGHKLAYCPHAVTFNRAVANDRGGAHGTRGARRVAWVIINNWRFVKKHEVFLRSQFDVGSPIVYIVRFSVARIHAELIRPVGLRVKRALSS